MTPEGRAEAIEALRQATTDHPSLRGTGFYGEGEINIEETALCLECFRMLQKATSAKHSSLDIAQRIGAWSGKRVSIGAVIIAAIARGFVVKPWGQKNPNAGIGIADLSLRKMGPATRSAWG
jgi:hypothetical protein